MKVWKEIARPGRYHTPGGVVDISASRLRHWDEQARAMLSKGLQMPVPWEHQDQAKPVSAEERAVRRARDNAGFALDTELRTVLREDGTGGHEERLYGLLEIPDGPEAEKVLSQVRYVSPEILEEFTDGDGTVWQDVLTHVALTPRPVAHRQEPFTPANQLSYSAREGRLRLSLAQMEGTRMALKDDVEDREAGGAEDDVEEEPAEVEEEAAPPRQAPDEETDTTKVPANDEEYLEELKTQLPKIGLHLPAHTSLDTFLRDLCVACHAIAQAKQTGGFDYAGPPHEEHPMGLTLSLNTQGMTLEQQVAALSQQNAELMSREALVQLGRLVDNEQIDPKRARDLKAALTKKRMSFAGPEVTAILLEIEVLGRNPKGTFGPGRGKRKTLAQPRLSHEGQTNGDAQEEAPRTAWGSEDGEMVTRERSEEATREILKNAGLN